MLEQQQVSQLLGSTELFTNLSSRHLDVIANACKVVAFENQHKIVQQGESGDQLFIVASGRVAVIHEEREIGSEQLITTLEARQCFGETSLLAEAPRSASIKALEQTICVVLAKRSFDSVLEQIPEVALSVSRFLAVRLHHQCQLTGLRFVSFQDLIYDTDLYAMFPTGLLTKVKAIPLKLEEGTLTVALTNPNQPNTMKLLREACPNLAVEVVVCAPEDYESFVRRNRPPVKKEVPILLPGDVSAELCLPDGTPLTAPLSSLIRQALNKQVRHIVLQDQRILCLSETGLETFCELSDPTEFGQLTEQISQAFFQTKTGPEVVTSVLSFEPSHCHLQLSRIPTLNGDRYSVTLIESEENLPTISELLPDLALRAGVVEQLTKPGNLVLLLGPNRSGRSTTAYSLLSGLQREYGLGNIVTMERKPLLHLHGIPQAKMGEDWESITEATLIQSPRFLMADEIELGRLPSFVHRVAGGPSTLVCLSSDDPIGDLGKMCQSSKGGEACLDSVGMLLESRLLPRLCPHCREEHEPSEGIKRQLKRIGVDSADPRYYQSAGCTECFQTGALGKVVALQALTLNSLVRELIVAGRPAAGVRKTARGSDTLVPFSVTASYLLRKGDISAATCLRFFGEGSS